MPCKPCFISSRDLAQHFARITRRNHARWDVVGDNTTCPDNRPRTNRDAGSHRHIGSEPTAIPDYNRFSNAATKLSFKWIKKVVAGVQTDFRAKQNVIANGHRRPVQNGTVIIGIKMITYADIPAKLTMKVWIHKRFDASLAYQFPKQGIAFGWIVFIVKRISFGSCLIPHSQ